ncbi:MAG: hypothetical protein VKJ02_16445 [Snowella sp.]|nr:hypothetical protein [Snowella sp.]
MKSFTCFTSFTITAIAVVSTITTIPSHAASTTSKAQSACLSAVAKVVNTNASKLSVIQAKETSKGVEIQVKVPGAEKPWLCTSTKNGTVKKGSVMYSGEG